MMTIDELRQKLEGLPGNAKVLFVPEHEDPYEIECADFHGALLLCENWQARDWQVESDRWERERKEYEKVMEERRVKEEAAKKAREAALAKLRKRYQEWEEGR